MTARFLSTAQLLLVAIVIVLVVVDVTESRKAVKAHRLARQFALQDKADAEVKAVANTIAELEHAYVTGRGHGYELALALQNGQFRTGPSNTVDWPAVAIRENGRCQDYISKVMSARLHTNSNRLITITNLTNSASMPNTNR